MRPEARSLAQELLKHHRERVKAHPPGKRVTPANYTVRYGVLCERAGLPHLVRIVGQFLGEVAEWCEKEDWPPLNSLAVGENGVPGEGYDGAGGFHQINWPADVEMCIRFSGYPDRVPQGA